MFVLEKPAIFFSQFAGQISKSIMLIFLLTSTLARTTHVVPISSQSCQCEIIVKKFGILLLAYCAIQTNYSKRRTLTMSWVMCRHYSMIQTNVNGTNGAGQFDNQWRMINLLILSQTCCCEATSFLYREQLDTMSLALNIKKNFQ